MIVILFKSLSIDKHQKTLAMLVALNKISLVNGSVFPFILALSLKFIFQIEAWVRISILKELNSFSVLIPVVKLAFIKDVLLEIINKLAVAIFLPNFVLSEVHLSVFFELLPITIDKTIEEVTNINGGSFSDKLNVSMAVLFIGKQIALVKVFVLAKLNSITLSYDVLHRSLRDVVSEVKRMVVVAYNDEWGVIFMVIGDSSLIRLMLYFSIVIHMMPWVYPIGFLGQ